MFAALEAKDASNPGRPNTIAIAGLDGYARAKTTFVPIPVPYAGCAEAVLPTSAHVAAGKVFFADGTGAVRSLAPGGPPVAVTSFPLLTSQQMLSFAVSPDGSRLLATIFTLPPMPAGGGTPCTSASPAPFGPGDFTLDVYAAQAGSQSHLLYHEDLGVFGGQQMGQVLEFIGWDALGPLGTYPSEWATQGGGPQHYWGTPVRVDAASGKVLKQVDATCRVMDLAPSGDYLCLTTVGNLSVRRPDGTEVWFLTGAYGYPFQFDLLSPDESEIADYRQIVYFPNWPASSMPAGFAFTGWLDSASLIKGDLGSNMSYLVLKTGAVVDLGFRGAFVGTVQTA